MKYLGSQLMDLEASDCREDIVFRIRANRGLQSGSVNLSRPLSLMAESAGRPSGPRADGGTNLSAGSLTERDKRTDESEFDETNVG